MNRRRQHSRKGVTRVRVVSGGGGSGEAVVAWCAADAAPQCKPCGAVQRLFPKNMHAHPQLHMHVRLGGSVCREQRRLHVLHRQGPEGSSNLPFGALAIERFSMCKVHQAARWSAHLAEFNERGRPVANESRTPSLWCTVVEHARSQIDAPCTWKKRVAVPRSGTAKFAVPLRGTATRFLISAFFWRFLPKRYTGFFWWQKKTLVMSTQHHQKKTSSDGAPQKAPSLDFEEYLRERRRSTSSGDAPQQQENMGEGRASRSKAAGEGGSGSVSGSSAPATGHFEFDPDEHWSEDVQEKANDSDSWSWDTLVTATICIYNDDTGTWDWGQITEWDSEEERHMVQFANKLKSSCDLVHEKWIRAPAGAVPMTKKKTMPKPNNARRRTRKTAAPPPAAPPPGEAVPMAKMKKIPKPEAARRARHGTAKTAAPPPAAPGTRKRAAAPPAAHATKKQATAPSEFAWAFENEIEVLDRCNKWLPAKLMTTNGDECCVHFKGWSKSQDEWVTADRIRKVAHMVCPFSPQLSPHLRHTCLVP